MLAHRTILTQIVFSFCLLQFSCVKKGPDTAVAHMTGEMRRNLALIIPCSQDALPAGKYPKAQAYAFAVLSHIAKANPETFRNEIAPERLCIEVVESSGNRMAGAVRGTSQIRISAAMLRVFSSDAQLAATLSHELAHIAAGHDVDHLAIEPRVLEAVRRRHPELDEAFFREFDELEQMNAEILAHMSQQDSPEFKEHLRRRDTLRSSIQGKIDTFRGAVDLATKEILTGGAGANWKEQEADEIGFALYLRSGFSAAQFWKSYYSALGDPSLGMREKSRECAARMLAFQRGETTLERGYQTHPEWCWRIHNIVFSEFAAKRKTDYRTLLARARTTNILPELRAEAVRELGTAR